MRVCTHYGRYPPSTRDLLSFLFAVPCVTPSRLRYDAFMQAYSHVSENLNTIYKVNKKAKVSLALPERTDLRVVGSHAKF